ncbi:type II toxin-antitoxin system RelE/ParE family toxin [Enterovirga aerilata]|uniref:Type II toxin-antitoxin system RelE/ParE family toxin n=1 Tax=Enterovirga aerilata TaxID=2730920 RepID=A0A849IAU7_9HYPH|nr:type II toxin-antitoxin system RelE/ParE family toxin [Enterovirga sp. DB1703]
MKVRWTSPALRQLRAAETYLQQADRKAAARIVRRIEEAAGRLARTPHIGRPMPQRDVRELVVSGTRYIIIYQVERDEVLILALFHERQQRPTSPGRPIT